MTGLPPNTPLDYLGPHFGYAALRAYPRRPLPSDRTFLIGQFLVLSKNPQTGVYGELWYLAKFDSSGNAVWYQLSGGGGGVNAWNTVSAVGPTTMEVHNGYNAVNAGSQVLLLLPPVSAIYDVIKVMGSSTGGWRITQSANQQIFMNVASSTIGITGYMEATMPTDYVELICTTANTNWKVISSEGNPNLA